MKYYVVIPAHNEADFLAGALQSVGEQQLLPKRVVVVNDNSTDATESIIDDFVARDTLFQKVNISSSTLHLPGSKVINAFNAGLDQLDSDFDFIVKLDADVLLPKDYFEQIATIFSNRPKVGIAGGFAYEQNEHGEWKLNHPMNKVFVRGAFKSYTKACFEAIGGLKNAMGWDTLDELLARYHGFTTYTEESLHVKQLRPVGRAYDAKAKLLQGKAMYTLRYGFLITTIASAKMAVKQGALRIFFNNMVGYFKARKERTPYLVTPEEGKFIRKFRWKGIRDKLFQP
ncbi:glycosyltransferase family A protein [Flavobacteriaceae bacterium 3-367]